MRILKLSSNRYLKPVGWMLGLALALSACSKKDESGAAAQPLKPKEAATQLQQAFVSSAPEVQTTVNTASEALRKAEYETAVQSLYAVRSRPNLTFEQGIAIHNSMVSLEANLIRGVESGDPNAKRAYDLLKKMRRN